MTETPLEGLQLGRVLKCKDGYTWVYVGYRVTSIGTNSHYFTRALPYGEGYLGPATPLWTYNATSFESLRGKFPELAKTQDISDEDWRPIDSSTPVDRWIATKKEGEKGSNVCKVWPRPGGEVEWCDVEGRTTVTHHSFVAPTHWRPLSEEDRRWFKGVLR